MFDLTGFSSTFQITLWRWSSAFSIHPPPPPPINNYDRGRRQNVALETSRATHSYFVPVTVGRNPSSRSVGHPNTACPWPTRRAGPAANSARVNRRALAALRSGHAYHPRSQCDNVAGNQRTQITGRACLTYAALIITRIVAVVCNNGVGASF